MNGFVNTRRYVIVLFLLLCGVSMYSCLDTEIERESIEEKDKPVLPGQRGRHLQAISLMGYDIENVAENDNFYFVEGDIMIRKDSIPEINEVFTRSAYYYKNRLVSRENLSHIYVKCELSDYNEIVKDALNAWNSIEGRKFEFFLMINNPDISIREFNTNDGVQFDLSSITSSEIPSGGKPGKTIIVWTNNYRYGTLPKSNKVYNLVHALGHAIGFSHSSDMESKDIIDGVNIPDYEWFMQIGHSANVGWGVGGYGFHPLDKKAIAIVYPYLSEPSIEIQRVSSATMYVGGTIEYKVVNHTQSQITSYEWVIEGATVVSKTSNSITIMPLTPSITGKIEFKYSAENYPNRTSSTVFQANAGTINMSTSAALDTVTLELSARHPEANTSFSFPGAEENVKIIESGNTFARVVFNTPGAYTIKANVTYPESPSYGTRYDYSVTKNIQITPAKCNLIMSVEIMNIADTWNEFEVSLLMHDITVTSSTGKVGTPAILKHAVEFKENINIPYRIRIDDPISKYDTLEITGIWTPQPGSNAISHSAQPVVSSNIPPVTVDDLSIKVAMSDCGLAAGAQNIYNTFRSLSDWVNRGNCVSVIGCLGLCQYEPMVQIYMPGSAFPVTYVNLTPEKAARIARASFKGEILPEYMLDGAWVGKPLFTVPMGSCGIEVGAREVNAALIQAIASTNFDAEYKMSGCIGICQYEPLLLLRLPGSTEETIYVYMTPEKVDQVVRAAQRGNILNEYTIQHHQYK